jgi:hypothetical protein
MNEGSIAKDTMAVCFATILLVALLLGVVLLWPADPQPEPTPRTVSVTDAPGPYIF